MTVTAPMVKFGLIVPVFASRYSHVDTIYEVAEVADRGNFDAVWGVDHLLSEKSATDIPIDFPHSNFEPIVTLSALSSRTIKVKLGTFLILPLRNPVILSKEISTLDFLSKGRVLLGLALGWNPREYEACNTPFRERGAIFTEYIEVLRKLLSKQDVSFAGHFGTLKDASIAPRPLGSYPMWIAAMGSNRGYRRAAELGDGWLCSWVSPDTFRGGLQKIRKFACMFGRDISKFDASAMVFTFVSNSSVETEKARKKVAEFAHRVPASYIGHPDPIESAVVIGTAKECVEKIHRYVDAGATDIRLSLIKIDPEQVEVYSKEIIPCFMR